MLFLVKTGELGLVDPVPEDDRDVVPGDPAVHRVVSLRNEQFVRLDVALVHSEVESPEDREDVVRPVAQDQAVHCVHALLAVWLQLFCVREELDPDDVHSEVLFVVGVGVHQLQVLEVLEELVNRDLAVVDEEDVEFVFDKCDVEIDEVHDFEEKLLFLDAVNGGQLAKSRLEDHEAGVRDGQHFSFFRVLSGQVNL